MARVMRAPFLAVLLAVIQERATTSAIWYTPAN
jgi:hypothetical protein